VPPPPEYGLGGSRTRTRPDGAPSDEADTLWGPTHCGQGPDEDEASVLAALSPWVFAIREAQNSSPLGQGPSEALSAARMTCELCPVVMEELDLARARDANRCRLATTPFPRGGAC